VSLANNIGVARATLAVICLLDLNVADALAIVFGQRDLKVILRALATGLVSLRQEVFWVGNSMALLSAIDKYEWL